MRQGERAELKGAQAPSVVVAGGTEFSAFAGAAADDHIERPIELGVTELATTDSCGDWLTPGTRVLA